MRKEVKEKRKRKIKCILRNGVLALVQLPIYTYINTYIHKRDIYKYTRTYIHQYKKHAYIRKYTHAFIRKGRKTKYNYT